MKTIFADPKALFCSMPVIPFAIKLKYLDDHLDLMKECARAFKQLWLVNPEAWAFTTMIDVLPVQWKAGKGEIMVAYLDEDDVRLLAGRREVRPAVVEFTPPKEQIRFEAVLSVRVHTGGVMRRVQRFALPLDADLLALVTEVVAPAPAPPPAPRAPVRRAPRSASAPPPTPLR